MKQVPRALISYRWQEYLQLLLPAIEQSRGRHTPKTIQAALMNEEMQLWLTDDQSTVAVTEVTEYPAMKVLAILFLGGSGRCNWMEEGSDVLTSFAKKAGAAKIELFGRKGWAREAEKFGYSITQYMYEIDIED